MKLVKTQDAVGQVLCHDITRIVQGVEKDAVFRKGHIISEEDIPLLLSIGKDHIYIWENDENMMHENEAAEVLCQICQGRNMHHTEVKEGKIEFISDCYGIFIVDVEGLRRINTLGEMVISTIPSGFVVTKGQRLAGTRIIPLLIERKKMDTAISVAGKKPLLNVLKFRPKKYGVVTTGNEIFNHRIEDIFTPVIEEKLNEYGCEMVKHIITDDDNKHIEEALSSMIKDKDVEFIICTGGMSVDPDDRTPLAIKNSGATIVLYGAPVLPGSMFLMAYLSDGRPVVGLPGCVMYAKRTIFDLVLSKIMADLPVTKEYLSGLGHGGFCQNCKECHFPNCSFGKGI